MAIRLGDAVDSFAKGADWRQKRQSNRLDSAKSIAALQEAGYTWDGSTLNRDPNIMGTKQIERNIQQSKYEDLLDPTREARREATKFGAVLDELDKRQGFGSPAPTGDLDAQIEALKQELLNSRQNKAPQEKTVMDDPLGVLS